MALSKQKQPSWIQLNAIRIARMHFYYVLAYAGSAVLYDAWKLISPKAVLQRWTISAVMLTVTTLIWYGARAKDQSLLFYRSLIYIFILLDIYVAGFTVYAERGMASRAVALFAVPIIIAATLLNRRALFATAALCTAAYSFAAVKYFVDYFNEGYKVELYTVIIFYSACFFVLAGLLTVVIRNLQSPK